MEWCVWRGYAKLIGGDAHGLGFQQKGTLKRDCIQISIGTAEHGPVKNAENVGVRVLM